MFVSKGLNLYEGVNAFGSIFFGSSSGNTAKDTPEHCYGVETTERLFEDTSNLVAIVVAIDCGEKVEAKRRRKGRQEQEDNGGAGVFYS